MTSKSSHLRSASTVRDFKTRTGASDVAARVFGASGRIAVERAVAELRAGRPVRLTCGAEAVVVAGAETMLPLSLDARSVLPTSLQLVLTRERWDVLGASVSGAAQCEFDNLLPGAAELLVAARSVDHLPVLVAADQLATGAVDLIKFAQLLPAALVGALATPADIATFDWLVSVTLDDVRNYHHEIADDLTIVSRAPVPLAGDIATEFVVFRGGDGLKDQVAIVVGTPDPQAPVPIRLHSACLTGDLFASLKCDCGEQLRGAVSSFAEGAGGVLLYLDQEGRGIGLGNKMRAYALQSDGFDTLDADAVLGYGADERRYAIAAQMVALLGYRRVSLLTNNPRKIAALNAHGIDVAERVALVGTVNPHNEQYLRVKSERSGHLVEFPDRDAD